jgi:uncharacterized protein (UPF0276 family)
MLAGIAWMLEPDLREAALPLFREGLVDALEWSFDVGFARTLAQPVEELLDEFARAGRLVGHGVRMSPLSGAWTQRQTAWLAGTARECARREYRWLSEHYGFLTAGPFLDGSPLPVPVTRRTIALGSERLASLADVAQRPVGLENLAFAFGREDVARQGEALDGMLAACNGFLLLDLHNVWCQIRNFGADHDALLQSYPLERVRELHVSGGSDHDGLRRDTHDGPVPEDVFALLEITLDRCPNVELVVLERLGGSLRDETAREQWRADYRRMRAVVQEAARAQ